MAIRYRSRTEIIASILQAIYDCGSQVNRTKLMYRTLLSHSQFREYVELLVGKGLIEYDSINNGFRITERGIAFLRAWEHIEEMLPVARAIPSRTYDSFGIA
ncbi:MAG TPA: winged helix-turn-helix domain-containing protein [Nitrososphaera sp.]|jgi:predicted transcriptional regulator|nr:winged helix-turn-helix domain-containing protein [Nitrososphaera sp.]